ncbi:MAG: glycosyltransferase family 2 protein [Clostridia bacterium]|nr:glycosyltransferase family 2 protein [Clostridia bacterium]
MTTEVFAVVVTYNRKELLCECLDAILNQSYPVKRIIVVNNNSTDGTLDYLNEKGYSSKETIEILNLPENIGGAGGFYEGMKHARDSKEQPDFVWIMDDDTIPTVDCLKELVDANDSIDEEVSFLASAVRGMNNEAMNVPKIARKQFNKYTDWYSHLDKGMAQIVKATFVSLLINIKAINKCGLPWKEFFIWGDDSEYTQRIIRDFGPAFMVGRSLAVHKRVGSDELSLVKEKNPNRIKMYFYYYRNNLIGFWEYESALYRFLCMGKLGYDFFGVLFKGKYKLKKMGVILKAFNAFVFGTYDRKAFKERAKL